MAGGERRSLRNNGWIEQEEIWLAKTLEKKMQRPEKCGRAIFIYNKRHAELQ